MGSARTVGMFALGAVAGIAGSWLLSLAYSAVMGTAGSLAVPFVVSALAGGVAIWFGRQALGAGILAGAAAETAFFVHLFTTWSRGLSGF